MSGVLVTHADEPIGRRIVKTLFHDERVGSVLALGDGPPPRSFDPYLSGTPPKVAYVQVDLARHRPVADFFHSSRFRDAAVETVVHVPRHGHGADDGLPVVSGLPVRTAEARLVLQNALEVGTVGSLVALGSAFVYRFLPGNANRLRETSEINLDPSVDPDLRSWIDCDMIFHGEIGNECLRVVLLRIPTVVASGGFVYLNPSLAGPAGPRLRPLGFDPLCALVSDKDVAKAVQCAVHANRAGVFNVAGQECVPLSVLGRWTRRPSLPLPGPLLRALSGAAEAVGAARLRASLDGAHLRYGFTLDTSRAERELGFRSSYRIGLDRAGDGALRLETSSTAV